MDKEITKLNVVGIGKTSKVYRDESFVFKELNEKNIQIEVS